MSSGVHLLATASLGTFPPKKLTCLLHFIRARREPADQSQLGNHFSASSSQWHQRFDYQTVITPSLQNTTNDPKAAMLMS